MKSVKLIGRLVLALAMCSTQACYRVVRPDSPRPVALDARTGAAIAALAPCSTSPALAATEAQQEQARLLNDEATQASETGDMPRATATWSRSVALDPQNIEAWRNLAVAHEQSSRVGQAITAYCSLARAAPDSPDARAATLRAAELSHSRMPERATTQFQLGLSLAEQSQWDEALRAYTGAVSEAPAWPDAYLNRALVREVDRDFSGAVRDLNRYLELYPSAPERPLVLDKIDALQLQLTGERKFSPLRTFLLTAPVVALVAIDALGESCRVLLKPLQHSGTGTVVCTSAIIGREKSRTEGSLLGPGSLQLGVSLAGLWFRLPIGD